MPLALTHTGRPARACAGGPGARGGGAPAALDPKETPAETRSPGGRRGAPDAAGVLPAGREAGRQPTARRRSEQTLAAVGKETALDTCKRLEDVGEDQVARHLRAWLNRDPASLAALLASLPATRGGQGRELRVAMCGVAFVARRGESVGFARRACKDRLCPDCSARRSRRLAAALRDAVARKDWAPGSCCAPMTADAAPQHDPARCSERGGDGCHAPRRRMARCRGIARGARCDDATCVATRVLFVTLTQRKIALEQPRAALDRLLESFRRFRQTVFYGRQVVGGIRALECTARGKGDRVGGYAVEIPGIHAHLHCLLEVRAGVAAGDIVAAWLASADAESYGVDVQTVNEQNIYQVADYPVNMEGLLDVLTAAPGYVRAVLAALHGRRLVEPLGAWRAWDLGLREAEGSLVYGDRAVYTLATNDPDAAATFKWADGRVEPTDEVLRALLEGPVEPLGGAGSAAPTVPHSAAEPKRTQRPTAPPQPQEGQIALTLNRT